MPKYLGFLEDVLQPNRHFMILLKYIAITVRDTISIERVFVTSSFLRF
ncbi:hypothetical protein Q2T41_14670 [Maribacter confluentis]|uniref:Uncharacterized protein n=1 Tax=Maribacter confluentis TaxID=1656093 RepID=A0ABT8RU19_9FLAO|nr:hypothetical protein [Maribacter confluentis]MDO1513902.1 hypothetical protein [Maribacter confluentis]